MYLLPKVASIEHPVTQVLKEPALPRSEAQSRQLLCFSNKSQPQRFRVKSLRDCRPKCVTFRQFGGTFRNKVYKT